VNVDYAADLDTTNNSFEQTVEIYGYPDVSLGPDLVVYTTEHTLDAGSGFVSYLWHDGSTSQQFIIEHDKQTPDSSYSVTVTDDNGCKTLDEVKIEFDIQDISPVMVSNPVSACTLTDQDTLRVVVRNNGSQPIFNEQIKITASVDGGIPQTVQQTLITPLDPGDSLEFIFGFTFDFSALGDHRIHAYTTYAKDADPDNDTLRATVTHVGKASPDLGFASDSFGTGLPYTLDAGSDFASYTWNGNPGSRTHDATAYGWYILEVTDSLGCPGRDSVYLKISNSTSEVALQGALIVYPIPANEKLIIDYQANETGHYFLEIFDLSGRKVFIREYKQVEEIQEIIEVSDMAKGMYYLMLRSGYKREIRQIIIE
jgi:hypothetical protein